MAVYVVIEEVSIREEAKETHQTTNMAKARSRGVQKPKRMRAGLLTPARTFTAKWVVKVSCRGGGYLGDSLIRIPFENRQTANLAKSKILAEMRGRRVVDSLGVGTDYINLDDGYTLETLLDDVERLAKMKDVPSQTRVDNVAIARGVPAIRIRKPINLQTALIPGRDNNY